MPTTPNDKVEQPDITDDKIDTFLDKIANDVGESIRRQLDDDELSAVHELISYQPSTGGKRLRPALAVLISQALGGDYEQTIEIATTAELLHNSSLVMDDVLDGDLIRRGKPTAHALFGAGTAMMGGNILALMAFKLGGRRGFTVLNTLVGTASNLALGSTEEFLFHEYNEERYLRIVGLKTASLFKAPCEIGAIIAGAARPEYETAMKYGWSIGMLYQLTDDLVDILKTHNSGEPAGHMRNGTPTLAFIHAYHATHDPLMRSVMDKFLKSPPLSMKEFEMVYEALLELKSIDHANERIEEFNKACFTCCTQLPVSRSRDYLAAMPRYMYRKQMQEAGQSGV